MVSIDRTKMFSFVRTSFSFFKTIMYQDFKMGRMDLLCRKM